MSRPTAAVSGLVACQIAGLWLYAVGMDLARQMATAAATSLVCCSLALTFASALWMLTRPTLSRAERNVTVVCLGVVTAIQYRLKNPLLFVGFDEQLHWRTLQDVLLTHGIFETNPVLPVSSRYPGLEALTALVIQLGVPAVLAAVLVVLVARVVLVTVLCDAVERVTGSARAGGIAVAVYAVCDQFVVFMSQYAYQTLALPLALAAVAAVARARHAQRPVALLAVAASCLVAVVVTHHVTNALTTAFLCLWALLQRNRRARRRVGSAALFAVALTVAWIVVQWSRLREYFEPIVEYTALLIVSDQRREVFSDSAGSATPAWERAFLVFYTAALCIAVAYFVVAAVAVGYRRLRRSPDDASASQRFPLLPVAIICLIPPVLAARVLPNSGETIARAPAFLFLPLSLLVAAALLRHHRRPRDTIGGAAARAPDVLARGAAVVVATGVFLGGFLLGSGPDWLRLPGDYLVSADSRSMDSQSLAAVRWAGDNLPHNSRIAADRVASVLLASQAGLWPVSEAGGVSGSSLYYADTWTAEQTELVRRLQVRYLFVDRRLAAGPPRVGSNFLAHAEGELGRTLTEQDLAKFDRVPGMVSVYRRGDVAIYDLAGLGPSDTRTNLVGPAAQPRWWPPLVGGAATGVAGMVLAGSARGRSAWRTVVGAARTVGAAGTFAGIVGLTVTLAVALVLTRVWLGPMFFAALLSTVAAARWRFCVEAAARLVLDVGWRWFALATAAALATAGAVGIAAVSAASAGA